MTWHLETERLRLRPMEPGDLDPFHVVVSDPVSMRFYPKPFDREATRAWIERVRRRYEDHGFGLLAVVEKETGEMIGDCGPMLMPVDRDELVELGWHIRRDRQGRVRDRGRCRLPRPRLVRARRGASDQSDPTRERAVVEGGEEARVPAVAGHGPRGDGARRLDPGTPGRGLVGWHRR